MMKCVYENGKIIFENDSIIKDGEYILINNNTDDFSLYPVDEFNKFQNEIGAEVFQKNDKIKMFVRYILFRADVIRINRRVLKLAPRNCADIYSREFRINMYDDHYRLIGQDKDDDFANQNDLVESLWKALDTQEK